MHPFDIQEAMRAKHAQHVVLVHFPIAVFMVGVLFDYVAQWTKRRPFASAAYYNLVVAALSTLPVMATGLLAWQFQLEGQKLKGILLQHLVLGGVSSVMICIVWFIHFRSRRTPEQMAPLYRLPIEFLAVTLVAVTAHLGGFLSGVNGPG